PPGEARRLRAAPPPAALAVHCARGDWPASWPADGLAAFPNWGLLLRWEAALAELAAFRDIPEPVVAMFLERFAAAVHARLAAHPELEALPVPALKRSALGSCGWDSIQTIFPFLLRGKHYLHASETREVYRLLAEYLPAEEGMSGDLGALRCRLGQPVACGERDGVPISALRLCMSARLVVEACSDAGRNAQVVIDRAMLALDKAALLARHFAY
ncbi:MAG: hypothetical protein HGA47_16080, partial [Zoogloea sp.]|nr:hypothetical protein [Zoogloea sp.]